MSIATKRGDAGETGLIGDVRISKGDLQVEAYGSVDELIAVLGFARSLCSHAEVAGWTETIQRTLFRVGSALSTPAGSTAPPALLPADVTFVTDLVYRIEGVNGILADWSLPGAHRESAAFEMARTTCRRVERQVVRLRDSGQPVSADVLAYLNRLSDLLWLFGRLIEHTAGVDGRLRTDPSRGPEWSRAW